MKAPSRHKSSLSGSFRQVSRVGLTLQLRRTAPSDEDGLFSATARDRRRGCLRCNSRENHGSDGVPFLHNAVLLSTIISLNLRGVALHRGGRAGHRSTRVKSRRYATRAMARSEEHTSELQSPYDLVCRLLLEKKKLYVIGTATAFSSASKFIVVWVISDASSAA